MQRGDVHFVCRKGRCSQARLDQFVRERYILLQPIEQFTVYGTYGGIHGKDVYPGEFLVTGHYQVNGVTSKRLDMNYVAECPLSHTSMMYDGTGSLHRISYMVNCALDSPELGVGLSVGLMGGFCSNDEVPGFRYAAVATMSFDDNPDLFIEEENYGEPETVPSREVMYASVSNGMIPIGAGKSGMLVHPVTRGYRLPNEAATKYFQKWMGWTEDEILQFRLEAMEFFRDHMEVPSVKPEEMHSEPVDNNIDLGGGNSIVPYTVTELAEHHLIGTKQSSGAEWSDARVHEVGFVLTVGRAGIWTYARHIPYGSVIQYGYYVVEFESGSVPIKFYDHYPQVPNTNSHFAVVQRAIHPEHGYGMVHGLLKVKEVDGFLQMESKLNWRWDGE